MTFGELLRHERTEANRTLREVGELLDLTIPYLSDVERGKRAPLAIAKVRKVAKYLGCAADELVMLAAVERKLVCPHCGKAIQ